MKSLILFFGAILPTLVFASTPLQNDKYILNLVGQKPVEVEDVSVSYGIPTKIYYFSQNNLTGFELQLNKQSIDVAWLFGEKDQLAENKKAEQQAINFTKKLLGTQSLDLLIKPIKSGKSISNIKISGITIKDARCSSIRCMFRILR